SQPFLDPGLTDRRWPLRHPPPSIPACNRRPTHNSRTRRQSQPTLAPPREPAPVPHHLPRSPLLHLAQPVCHARGSSHVELWRRPRLRQRTSVLLTRSSFGSTPRTDGHIRARIRPAMGRTEPAL